MPTTVCPAPRRWLAGALLVAACPALAQADAPAQAAAPGLVLGAPADVITAVARADAERLAQRAPSPAVPTRTSSAPAAAPWTLAALLDLARTHSPQWAAERARVDGVRAAVQTAQALPNPELEWLPGRMQPRAGATDARGAVHTLGLTQRLEMPALRAARRGEAEAGAQAAQNQALVFLQDLLADVRLGYYLVLRREAELRSAEEDRALIQQIRQRVQARVEAGEAARFELIRADTELLNAERQAAAARLRIEQARAELRRQIGPQLPEDFRVAGQLDDALPVMPSLGDRESWLDTHPALQAARNSLRAAEQRIALEQRRAEPAFALRGAMEQAPGSRQQQFGVQVTVPLFDRRVGPIAEARAQAAQARALVNDRELQLNQARELALRQFELADAQVRAFENGIVREAENALRVAQAAYRFGERGILDFLDAQRSLRAARNELNAARFERWAALAELERLRAAAQP